MDKVSKVAPMRPLRDVLAEFESMIDTEQATTNDEVCDRCNDTRSELIRDSNGTVIGAKPCTH